MSIMTNELVNTNKYRVIERLRVEQIIQEQKFQATQMTSVQIARVGHILGVEKIIVGEISYESASIRLVDADSGEIESACTLYTSNFDSYYAYEYLSPSYGGGAVADSKFYLNADLGKKLIQKLIE